jgi:NADPH:quinone reductase
MKVVFLEQHGAPDVLRFREFSDPEPGPGQVVVRVEAIGINYAEVLSRKGLYGWAPKLPYVLGMEATGRIESLGPGVEDHAVGESVIMGMQSGAYAERVAMPADRVLPAIEGFSVEENAAFTVNFMTAWVALMEMARLRPTDRVAVTAAAGGVGTAAVQIAKKFGCGVVALAGSDVKLARVRELGADATVNYRDPGFGERLQEVVGDRGLDVVLEVVGGEVYKRCLASLAPLGRVVVAGFASMNLRYWDPLSWWRTWRDAPKANIKKLAMASTGVLASHIGYLMADETKMRSVWRELTSFVSEHGIRPVVGATFPFEKVADAHRLMEDRGNVGKIVIKM